MVGWIDASWQRWTVHDFDFKSLLPEVEIVNISRFPSPVIAFLVPGKRGLHPYIFSKGITSGLFGRTEEITEPMRLVNVAMCGLDARKLLAGETQCGNGRVNFSKLDIL